MNTVKKSTFNLLFILRKSKLLKNGEAPIFLRITVQGQVADIMVKRSIPVYLWNQKRECSNGKHYKDQELNHYLETVKAKFYQIHRELMMDGKKITASGIHQPYRSQQLG
jgi:hypothetical protein